MGSRGVDDGIDGGGKSLCYEESDQKMWTMHGRQMTGKGNEKQSNIVHVTEHMMRLVSCFVSNHLSSISVSAPHPPLLKRQDTSLPPSHSHIVTDARNMHITCWREKRENRQK